jgi:hypothetical protein
MRRAGWLVAAGSDGRHQQLAYRAHCDFDMARPRRAEKGVRGNAEHSERRTEMSNNQGVLQISSADQGKRVMSVSRLLYRQPNASVNLVPSSIDYAANLVRSLLATAVLLAILAAVLLAAAP